ncbi:hypothetical protein GCM10009751_39310 [Myceligenerans crystallogenes]|uniref:Uncharacterized protein n=1 Tax=Myceligenerans crystallogenes TaxID=316335 RepID=A0ABN2NPI6_9MICO
MTDDVRPDRATALRAGGGGLAGRQPAADDDARARRDAAPHGPACNTTVHELPSPRNETEYTTMPSLLEY